VLDASFPPPTASSTLMGRHLRVGAASVSGPCREAPRGLWRSTGGLAEARPHKASPILVPNFKLGTSIARSAVVEDADRAILVEATRGQA
jgi:hypothetical protein